MDNVSHLINAAMDIKSALMAVMNWTAVSTVVYRCENMNGLQILRGLSYYQILMLVQSAEYKEWSSTN